MFFFALTLIFGADNPCPNVALKAALHHHLDRIDGTLSCHVENSGALRVFLYANILGDSSHYNDTTRFWYYPRGFSSAATHLHWEPESGSNTPPPNMEAGRDPPFVDLGFVQKGTTINFRFTTRIPERNGTFGRHHDILYLLGGWHPVFGDTSNTYPSRLTYEVQIPPQLDGFVGNRPIAISNNHFRKYTGTFDGVYLPIFLAPDTQQFTNPYTTLVEPGEFSFRGEKTDRLRDVTFVTNRLARERLTETIATGALFAQKQGLAPSPLRIVITPLRERLVEYFDGGIAISDRAFHLLPFERLLKFHRLALWRAQFFHYARSRTRTIEKLSDIDQAADIVANGLREQLTVETYGKKEHAPDLLETYAVIPEIDALIFAPQITFADAYFDAIDESPPVRRQFDDFFHDRARGKVLYEKLVDRLGRVRVQMLLYDYLRQQRTWQDLITNQTGSETWAYLERYSHSYPQVDYSVQTVTQQMNSTTVHIGATGPDAWTLQEPITARITNEDGTFFDRTRLGPGPLTFPEVKNPQVIEIDPQKRLPELYQSEIRSPRFNNRTPPRWRFLLNDVSGLISLTSGRLALAADFSLRRIYDPIYRFDTTVAYSPDAWGLSVTASRGLGSPITPLRLDQRAGIVLFAEHLQISSVAQQAGNQFGATLFYSYDTRLQPYWSYEGQGLNFRFTGVHGWDDSQDTFNFLQAGAAGLYIVPLAFGHAIATRLRTDLQAGRVPIQNRLVLGDRYRGARGFEGNEARGKRRAIASVEYRHLLEGDGHTDFFGLLTWTQLEGGLFADAVYLPVDRQGCTQTMFYDVGYGLRFIGNILNVEPATFAIDVGVPIRRCSDEINRSPVTVYLSFAQSFLLF